ncbi:MAG: methyltransferase domain-containing protein [Pirellulales bacterium]|nr:methyltransferase domain-containing protein [Pirellulales bacterium]
MQETCPACGFRIAHPLYHPEPQPLAALNLPRSGEAAREALRFPMDFHVCAFCGHIFNRQFDYYRIPYEEDSNLMYNRGALWQDHMGRLVDLLVDEYDMRGKTLVDIGCGDGLFFQKLLQRAPECRCVGFEPGIEADNARRAGLEVYKDYFHPQRDLKRLRPDVLVCRHVIEHLQCPRDLVGEIAYWCNRYELAPLFLAEVPRIDNAIEQGRLSDFLYEHVSNFTDYSFRTLFETTGYDVLELAPCYGDEVLVALVRPRLEPRLAAIGRSTATFRQRIAEQLREVGRQLDALVEQGRSVAFWGATGKGAAFLNAFGVDGRRFPVVVDSDEQKAGRFVPGTGQEIRPPDYLRDHPADVIVITTRWRAKDIFDEIRRRQVRCDEALVLEAGRLQPYLGEDAWANEPSLRIEGPHPGGLKPASRRRAGRLV